MKYTLTWIDSRGETKTKLYDQYDDALKGRDWLIELGARDIQLTIERL